jgi:hypothetical protein
MSKILQISSNAKYVEDEIIHSEYKEVYVMIPAISAENFNSTMKQIIRSFATHLCMVE